MKIKRFLILTPIMVFAALLVSLCVASRHFDDKLNQLVLSSSGDAERLNPILATDSVSLDVTGEVFNGLLKYDVNMDLTPMLAESYEVSQVSFCYPKSETKSALAKAYQRLLMVYKLLSCRSIRRRQ